MKKTVLKVIAAVLVALTAFEFSAFALPADDYSSVEKTEISTINTDGSFKKVLENDGYALYFHPETAEISLTDKKSGYVWYSNPQNDGQQAANSKEKSQIVVYYYENRDLTSIDSYESCVELEDKMSWSLEDNKLVVSYDIGDDSFSSDALPTVLSKERMEKDILSKLDDDEKEVVLERYSLYSRETLDENALKTIKLNFPSIEKHDLYIRSKMPDYIGEEIYVLFQKAGYTTEDLQRDCDENQIENTYKAKPSYHIELEYILCEDGFKASVDTEKIKFIEDYKPCRIELLPYFGSATSEKGYMIVPDGCGAVIEFNNGKYNAASYWEKLFNNDNALTTEEAGANSQPAVLPIFAISKDNNGFLATIDSGYEVAGISADVAGGNNNYNYIHSFFDIFSADQVSLSSNEQDKFILTNEKIISCPIEISYHFLSGEHSYSDFALKYRELLVENEILSSGKNDSTVMNFDFIGTVQVTKRFLGIPYKATAALTTYNQAYELIENLNIENVSVNFLDSLKGGRIQKKADNLNIQGILGRRAERNKLADICQQFSVSYYGQYAAKVKKSDSAMTLSKSKAKLYDYDSISRYVKADNALNVVSAVKLEAFAAKITKSIKSNKYDSVNLLDLGYQLNSDFNSKQSVDRYQSKIYVQKYLAEVSKAASVSACVGSIFSLPYIDKIKDIPVTSSGYHIEDYTIPFYEIAISGYVPYSTPSINTAANARQQFLKTVELGGQLQYTWLYDLPDNITEDGTEYYKYLYINSDEQAKEYYDQYLPLYNKIGGKSIISHQRITDTLIKTVFDNDLVVYVNYSDEAIEIDGLKIEANDFIYIE